VLESELGRWMRRDPLGYVDGWNVYAVSRGGGIGYIDPLGLANIKPCPMGGGCGGGGGGNDPGWVSHCSNESNNYSECVSCCYYHSDGFNSPSFRSCENKCDNKFNRPGGPRDPRPADPPATSPSECLRPDNSNNYVSSCSIYPPCACLHGANVGCMCRCMSTSPWNDFVRGCLQCMLRVPGVNWSDAHVSCWMRATKLFGSPNPGELLTCVYLCRGYHSHQCGRKCIAPVRQPVVGPLPPGTEAPDWGYEVVPH
jgi:hypothetical protein